MACKPKTKTPAKKSAKPRYPEKYSALGIRIGVNYVVYAMSH